MNQRSFENWSGLFTNNSARAAREGSRTRGGVECPHTQDWADDGVPCALCGQPAPPEVSHDSTSD